MSHNPSQRQNPEDEKAWKDLFASWRHSEEEQLSSEEDFLAALQRRLEAGSAPVTPSRSRWWMAAAAVLAVAGVALVWSVVSRPQRAPWVAVTGKPDAHRAGEGTSSGIMIAFDPPLDSFGGVSVPDTSGPILHSALHDSAEGNLFDLVRAVQNNQSSAPERLFRTLNGTRVPIRPRQISNNSSSKGW